MKTEIGEEAAKKKLEAIRGQFIQYKERSHLYNIKVKDEAVRADVEAAASYPKDIAKIIHESQATLNNRFSLWMKQTYQKKIPSRNLIAREKSTSGFKGQVDSCQALMPLVTLN